MTGRSLILCGFLWSALVLAAADEVSLSVDEAPVVQVLQALAESQRVSLVIAPGVEGKLSLHLMALPWKQAFDAVTRAAGLVWDRKGNLVSVWPAGQRGQQDEAQAIARRKRLDRLPLSREVFPLSHASAGDLAAALREAGEHLLSARGSITVDARTNRLLVDDTRSALQSIRAWITEMDRPIGQVELIAHIVSMTQSSLRELGIKWSRAASVGSRSSFSADFSAVSSSPHIGFSVGRINGRLLEIELSALEQKRKLAFIASPRLLAAHQQPASIKQGSEIPYQVAGTEKNNGRIEFREAVLGMEVTPAILPRNRVRLKLRISQNMPGQKLKQGDGETLIIDKQEIETQIELREGETIALGGIFQQSHQTNKESVPLLGAIPVLGHLFSHDGGSQERRELVVFITPHLIKEG
ncbi:DNA uptake porin HofQ [Erwinia sp. CPCC 100877]|nr:DNA uptake porin HofQ [Erwinia sp. CPCC 100877]